MCKKCGIWCGSGRKYCKDCRIKIKQDLKEQSLQAKKSDAIYLAGEISNRYAKIRYHAREMYSKDLIKCERCGYDKHVEICHIKAIKQFSEESTIKEINDRSNIIGLCPNCHWEFDHGLLKIKNF
jgi:5-methylcytosine-specific restriction endonuclease McrA